MHLDPTNISFFAVSVESFHAVRILKIFNENVIKFLLLLLPGTTHTMVKIKLNIKILETSSLNAQFSIQVVPLDLVKCRIQVDPAKYKSVFNGFKVSLAEEGVKGLAKGWAPTFFGYSCQGLCKFGLYEVFKVLYADAIGEENAYVSFSISKIN